MSFLGRTGWVDVPFNHLMYAVDIVRRMIHTISEGTALTCTKVFLGEREDRSSDLCHLLIDYSLAIATFPKALGG